ncbi:twin-arginine translocation protein TatA [Rothia aeria]|uniref:Sec-independent protein translocase protein TatA n=1 Tax=Rothia aeria TaxID=172042 RepID=A0A2Z5R074_9MICC|nr:twin-arginine translocation protein TatA [Rothia aeria]
MGQIFSHPATIIVVILLIVLLFGAPKLPGMARSLGQSMRIFKSEVEGMKSDGKEAKKMVKERKTKPSPPRLWTTVSPTPSS